MALSFSFFFIGDSNRFIKDSNQSTSISLLEFGFESLHEGFESPSSVWTFWNVDLNSYMRDSNCLCQSELTEKWIRTAIEGIRIAFFSLNFLECGFESLYEGFKSPSSNLLEKLQNWRVNWGIRIALLGIQIWPLENSLKCSFVKIFFGIFIYILKHLFSLIRKHNMSVLVSSKSTKVQQSPPFLWWQNTLIKDWSKDSIKLKRLPLNICIIKVWKFGQSFLWNLRKLPEILITIKSTIFKQFDQYDCFPQNA